MEKLVNEIKRQRINKIGNPPPDTLISNEIILPVIKTQRQSILRIRTDQHTPTPTQIRMSIGSRCNKKYKKRIMEIDETDARQRLHFKITLPIWKYPRLYLLKWGYWIVRWIRKRIWKDISL